MSGLERLRTMAQAMPEGSSVTLPREAILEALGDESPVQTPPPDYTVRQLAERFGRSLSTVRGWLAAGKFPGAYRLRGVEWRVPPEGLRSFEETERRGAEPHRGARQSRGSLSDWRSARGRSTN